jgi:methylamine dehydrogenase heavy chain
LLVASLAALLASLGVATVARADDVSETVGKSLTLPGEPGPHWFWLSDVMLHRTALFDGERGEILGSIASGSPGVGFVIEPLFSRDHREIYLAESYFSRGVRGERTDVVTVYDTVTLAPVVEIPIPPKRAEYFPGVAANAISDDGRFLAVFNVTPAQSLTIVDTQARRTTAEIQTPGCSLVYPSGPRRFFMLCADGAALVATLADDGTPKTVERAARFFDPEKDPLFEKAARRGSEWTFTSFDGAVHSVDFSGDTPKFGEIWSLFSAADRRESWRLGGGQQIAVHAGKGRLYALVHQGGRDTHKEPGIEVWVYDLATRSRVQTIGLENPLASFIRLQSGLGRERPRDRFFSWALARVLPNTGTDGILVTQDDHPVLVALSMKPPAVTVYDALTGGVVREISEPGIAGSLLTAP